MVAAALTAHPQQIRRISDRGLGVVGGAPAVMSAFRPHTPYPMKRLAAVLLLASLVLAPLRAEMLGKVLEVPAVPGWKSVEPLDPGQPHLPFPVLKYVPVDGRNAAVMLSLLPANVPGHEVTDLASLKRFNRSASASYLPDPEDNPVPTDLKVPGGIGVYLSCVDQALVGKPVPPNEYRIATTATVLLDGQYLVHATIFHDELDSADLKEALKILLSIAPRPANSAI